MGDPIREDRIGEEWDEEKIQKFLNEIEPLKGMVVISGGFAWHLMSPPHVEEKHLHDHKDIDLFMKGDYFATVVAILKGLGFDRAWTRFDGQSKDFHRYTKYYGEGEGKLMLDLFMQEVPSVEVAGGWRVVEPKTLLSFYGHKHSSDQCGAVLAAKKLVEQGIDPVGRVELVGRWFKAPK